MAATRPRVPQPTDLAATRLVVIATSAGGLHALSVVLSLLPADFAAAVIVLQLRLPGHDDSLVKILRQRATLPLRQARSGQRLRSGVIDVAPPGVHLRIMASALLRLDDDERVQYVRPSASVLFGSAATVFAADLIAVVLTRRGEDGAAGLAAVRQAGGTVVVEDPASAAAMGMPAAAIVTGCVDAIVPLAAVALLLSRLVQGESATA